MWFFGASLIFAAIVYGGLVGIALHDWPKGQVVSTSQSTEEMSEGFPVPIDNLTLPTVQALLRALREGKCDTPSLQVDQIKAWAQKTGFDLNDLGTSERELFQLEARVYKKRAREWLVDLRQELRRGTSDPEEVELFIEEIRHWTELANCSLQEIGTSEQELDQILIKLRRRFPT